MSAFVRKEVGRERDDANPLARLWQLRLAMHGLGCRDGDLDRQRRRKTVGRKCVEA